jgi:hypothetical protein
VDTPPPLLTSPPLLASQDESHLDALAIAHFVVGGLFALLALLPLLHVAFGLAIAFFPNVFSDQNNANPPPAIVGWILATIGGFCVLLGETLAACIIFSGIRLRQRRGYLFSFIVACIGCVMVPFGSVLGIFTIIVLSRDSVKRLYAVRQPTA